MGRARGHTDAAVAGTATRRNRSLAAEGSSRQELRSQPRTDLHFASQTPSQRFDRGLASTQQRAKASMSASSGHERRRPIPPMPVVASALLSPDLAPADNAGGRYARPLPWIQNESALALGLWAGVLPLNLPLPCHGFANGCVCPQCQTRIKAGLHRPPEVKQPYEVSSSRHRNTV